MDKGDKKLFATITYLKGDQMDVSHSKYKHSLGNTKAVRFFFR